MNTESMHKVVRLDEQELQELTREVKETIAKQAVSPKKNAKKFTSAQMWNMKRRMSSAALPFSQIRVA